MNQRAVWAISLALLGLLIAGLYWWQLPARLPPPAPAPVPDQAPAAAAVTPPASTAPAIRYPIDAEAPAATASSAAGSGPTSRIAEALVDSLGRKAVLEFLNVDGFAHRVVATVDNLPRAHAPARLWPVHPAAGRLVTVTVSDSPVIGAENAKRYAGFVNWADSLDMKQVAALYRRVYPDFQRAYEELGYPGRYFNDRVVDVIDHLLKTPPGPEPMEVKLPNVKGPIQPTRPWVMIEFADPALEQRSAGQKLLLRMGSDNAQRLKVKLTELRAALTPPR